MKLTTKKYFAFITACLIVFFALVSFFGIHNRWGYTVNNHVKGWQNLRFGLDFNEHIEIVLKPENKKVNLNNEEIIKTIQDRLTFLGFSDNRIDIDQKNNLLTLKVSQPAGTHDFDTQTIISIVGSKGDFEINDSKAFGQLDNPGLPIINADIESTEIITQKDNTGMQKKYAPEFGIRIKLTENGAKKLADLTSQIIATSNQGNKDNTDSKNDSELTCQINGFTFDTQKVMFPITNGQLEFFKKTGIDVLKQNLAYLKTKNLPTTLLLKSLRHSSPELGLWFKHCAALTILSVFTAVALILILRFKLIGTVCIVCLAGHMAFMLACFTGFFKIYPGVIFNFAAFFGCMISFILGIISCFVISKRIQNKSQINVNQPFSLAIKAGVSSSCKLVLSWHLKLLFGSLILMAIFSYKTNLVAFAVQPIYDLLEIEQTYNNSIASTAYALFVGSVGAIIFEIIFVKYILSPITSPDIKFKVKLLKEFKSLLSKLKLKIKNKNRIKKDNKKTKNRKQKNKK